MNKLKSKISGLVIIATMVAASVAYAQNSGYEPMQQQTSPAANNYDNNGSYNNRMDAPNPGYHYQNRHSNPQGSNASRDNATPPPCWNRNAQNGYSQHNYTDNKPHGRHRGGHWYN